MIQLRGHHLFCLVGYRGMGYSEEYEKNMTRVHQQIRKNPDTPIQIVKGPDCLCDKFPKSKEYHCENKDIDERDSVILQMLNLKVGQIITWREIEHKIKQHVIPSDINIVCKNCSWRSYGVCEEGLHYICEGKGLVEVK